MKCVIYCHMNIHRCRKAGRRGIDTVGHVIHCNNLFAINSFPNDYRNMLTGPPKMLKSQFKISYNLILNILIIIYYREW